MDHLLLVYTGSTHVASQFASQMVLDLDAKKKTLRRLRRMVDECEAILTGNEDIIPIGDLLHESWLLKQTLASGLSTPTIDTIYQTAREHGAMGGKLLGAGGAGFMLLFAPPSSQPAVKKALAHLLWVPFGFDTIGSTIIYDDQVTERLIDARL